MISYAVIRRLHQLARKKDYNYSRGPGNYIADVSIALHSLERNQWVLGRCVRVSVVKTVLFVNENTHSVDIDIGHVRLPPRHRQHTKSAPATPFHAIEGPFGLANVDVDGVEARLNVVQLL